jgi:hypothetical protein
VFNFSRDLIATIQPTVAMIRQGELRNLAELSARSRAQKNGAHAPKRRAPGSARAVN